MRKLISIVLALSGCCFTPSAPPAPMTVVAPPTPETTAPAEPAVEPTMYHRAFVTFEGDVLDSCLQFDSTDRALSEISAIEGAQEISSSCREAFGGRPLLASCAQTANALTTVIYHYRYATALASDANMLACLRDGGQWNAVAQDSAEFRRARREAAIGDLQRAQREIRGR